MSSSYRISLDNWLKELDVKADRVLDIGGSQLPVKGRTKSWDVKEYLIADLPEPHVGSPKPDIELDMNEFVDLKVEDRNWDYKEDSFDLLFCLEVFDYVFDSMSGFMNIQRFLRPGGTAWVTFPSFYPTHNPVEDDALLYKEYGIRKLADNAGLKIIQMIKRRPETDALQQLWRRERMRAAKGYDHNFTGFICEFQK